MNGTVAQFSCKRSIAKELWDAKGNRAKEKCMWLKGVVMRAHFNGLIPRNPFAQFHISPNVKEQFDRLFSSIRKTVTPQRKDKGLAWLKRHFICARILLRLACVIPK